MASRQAAPSRQTITLGDSDATERAQIASCSCPDRLLAEKTVKHRIRLTPPRFRRFEDAYIAVLEEVLTYPDHRIDSRGNPGRECLNISFTVTDPADRVVSHPARRFNPAFCWAEFLWYTAGRVDLDMIGFYAPRLRRFSADGVTLTGSAYGPKLFSPAPSGLSQWERVVALLRRDPDSKRTVLGIFAPSELHDSTHPDVSCTLALQLLLRGDELHLVATMRGNDAVIGLACDVHAFTLIQEFTAIQLGVGTGSYTHNVASAHINDVTAAQAAQIVATSHRNDGHALGSAARMPTTTSWSTLATVRAYEEGLRTGNWRLRQTDLGRLDLDPYWEQVVVLFELHRQIRHQPDRQVTPWALEALTPLNRWLVTHRWPKQTITEQAHAGGGQR
jgi:thymidylate synthase